VRRKLITGKFPNVVFCPESPWIKYTININWQRLSVGSVSKPGSQKLYKEKREKYMKNYAEKEGY
jgi:hypothetical protein